jgi:hypothetical protein
MRRRTLIPLCIILSACSADADSTATVRVPTDSLVALENASTGEEYEFGRLSGVAVLPDGGVAATDALNNVVRVYDPAGVHRYSFGRSGAGPGEMTSPCCIAYGPDGLLWVRDGENARYSAYMPGDTGAAYVGMRRMQHTDANRWTPLTFDSQDRLIDIGTRQDEADGRGTYRMSLDSASTVMQKVRVHDVPDDSTGVKSVERSLGKDMTATLFFYAPYSPAELQAHSPTGEYAHMLSSRYEIDWRDESGNLIRHITGDVTEGPALSADERQRADERLENDAKRAGKPRRELGFEIPARKQPVRNLYFDAFGRLWVELSIPQGAARRADVYARDGLLERRVTWPGDVDLSNGAVTRDGVWGVRTDSLDVQTLIRLNGLSDRRLSLTRR